MIIATVFLFVLVAALSVVAYRQDPAQAAAGWRAGLQLLLKFLPLLLVAFFLVGMLQVAVPNEFIRRWLGDQSGLTGILLGSLLGAMIPAGPYVVFPIIAGLYATGASLGTVVALIAGWTLWSSGRIPYELALVGPRFTLVRLASAAVFPPLIGLVADLLF
jgi:uncharacterized membrane protein YraQ (UPF0718 family)